MHPSPRSKFFFKQVNWEYHQKFNSLPAAISGPLVNTHFSKRSTSSGWMLNWKRRDDLISERQRSVNWLSLASSVSCGWRRSRRYRHKRLKMGLEVVSFLWSASITSISFRYKKNTKTSDRSKITKRVFVCFFFSSVDTFDILFTKC